MTTDEVIEQIRTLSQPDELEKVSKALEERRAELQADLDAVNRIDELRSGKAKALSHEQVFNFVRNSVREG